MIESRPALLNGICTVTIQLPQILEFGLYNIELTVSVWGKDVLITEPHALNIYNATEIAQSIRFIQLTDTHVYYEKSRVIRNEL